MSIRGIKPEVSLLLLLLVEFLEMSGIRGKASASMAIQRPGKRDMLSRWQLFNVCSGQKI
jgi:hypothetical protein